MPRVNDGSESEKIFKKVLEAAYGKSCYLVKFPDTKMVKGLNRGAILPECPADYLVTAAGEMFYAEVKSTIDPIGFKLTLIRKAQKSAMLRQHMANGKYYVFIHSLATDTWYKIEGKTLLGFAKSPKWTELEKYLWTL